MWASRKEFCTIRVECACAMGGQGIWLGIGCFSGAWVAWILESGDPGQVLANILRIVAVARKRPRSQ